MRRVDGTLPCNEKTRGQPKLFMEKALLVTASRKKAAGGPTRHDCKILMRMLLMTHLRIPRTRYHNTISR